MKGFKFNLEIVRRLRGVDEDRKKREFGDALRGLMAEEVILTRLEDALKEHDQKFADFCNKALTQQDFKVNEYYMKFLRMQIKSQKQNIEKAQKKVDKKRAELSEAVKHKRMMDKLREKAQETYDHDLALEEQMDLDEMTSQRYEPTRP